MKYTETAITFREIPDEVCLCINISNCPNRCPDCHSKYLWDDIGKELTAEVLTDIIDKNIGGITCICFMGGDANLNELSSLNKAAKYMYPKLKTAWYSGRKDVSSIPQSFPIDSFDYIKVGPYITEFGPLTSKTTNQHLYKIDGVITDITYNFWK